MTVPVVHRTAQKKSNTVPHVLVNLREEMVFIPKGTILAELQLMTCSINQITTESYMQINEIEAQKALSKSNQNKETKTDNDKSEPSKDDMENLEKKFITSPADVDEHRKAELQDAVVTEEERNQFKQQLCEEFTEVFSKSSEDIGRTPLVTMEIETGDSPPVCWQVTYDLLLLEISKMYSGFLNDGVLLLNV